LITAALRLKKWILMRSSGAILNWSWSNELAHTNAPGSRHPKRYQDVLEILSADIDCFYQPLMCSMWTAGGKISWP